jgi:hypothetical protein
MIPKNIFFYWDTDKPSLESIDNIANYKKNNTDYNVKLLNNNDINKYKNVFPKLIKLFHLTTIAALKSDIIRFIFLYEEGGVWIDINTTLVNNKAIDILFNRYKHYDFVITLLPNHKNKLVTRVLISKPKSKLAYDTINQITQNLLKHYELEKTTPNYISYKMFLFTAPVVFYHLLEYKFNDTLIQSINSKFIKDNENNIISLNTIKFNNYNCGLMVIENLLKCYGCNMSDHHNINFHKHWSKIQKTQKLFFHNIN